MLRLVVIAILVAAAYAGARHFELVGKPEIEATPGSVIARIDGGTTTFSVNGPAEETYMVFGGDTGTTSFAQGSMVGIELKTIRRIARRYPDFHRCNSPGAPEAKKAAEHVNVVGKRAVLKQLADTVKEAESREARNGDRVCAAVSGQWLTLEQMEKGGFTISGEQYAAMVPAHATKQYFLHLETLEVRDCKGAI